MRQEKIMNAPIVNDEDKPLDPATEKVRRKLARYGAVFMGFNILALMAVLGAIVYKIGDYGNDASQPAASMGVMVPTETDFDKVIDLPDGAEILSASQNGNQILLNLALANGERALWIYDISTSRIIGRLLIR